MQNIKTYDYTYNSIDYIIQFELQKETTGITDVLLIEMNSKDDQSLKYISKVKVFGKKDGIESLKSIESIERIDEKFKIKFIYGNITTEGILENEMISK